MKIKGKKKFVSLKRKGKKKRKKKANPNESKKGHFYYYTGNCFTTCWAPTLHTLTRMIWLNNNSLY
jgi:hypothetical protein